MRSDARLESVIFQLTPTRTRCELVILSNGKTEKIASGLLKPFLAHLKCARDQIAKGGYSIKLDIDPKNDSEWFTKGTVERFVRFVSTPEVLERVNTIESEIIQIDEAVAIQANDNLGLSIVPNSQLSTTEYSEGIKPTLIADADKAIVLYKPDPMAEDPNEFTIQEENSKAHLLRVLENRKNVLRKEQTMAFARALAAGFDMDQILDLVSFAVAFGASRLREAALRFMELWKCKHETGQWIEVEVERSEFSLPCASGIELPGDTMIHKESGDGVFANNGFVTAENNSLNGGGLSYHQKDSEQNRGKGVPSGSHVAPSPPEHHQGQFPYHVFPQLPMHHPPYFPAYHQYPLQGAQYFHTYPGGAPYYPSPCPPEDLKFVNAKKKGHLQNSKGRRRFDKVGSGDMSYIKSKKHDKSDSQSQSASQSESEEDIEQNRPSELLKKVNGEDGQTKHADVSDTNGRDKMTNYQEAESQNWVAFQSFLMKAEEENGRRVDLGMFSGEVPNAGSIGDVHNEKGLELDYFTSKSVRPSAISSIGELPFLNGRRGFNQGELDTQFKEVEGGRGGYRRASNDEFIINGQQKQFIYKISSDSLAENDTKHPVAIDKYLAHNALDESFMLPFRSGSAEELSVLQNLVGLSSKMKKHPGTEPQDFYLLPDREIERVPVFYDQVKNYDAQIEFKETGRLNRGGQGNQSMNNEKMEKVNNGKMLRAVLEDDKKRRLGTTRKSKSTKLSPMQSGVERLRAYKVDPQKLKKEKEEEAIKRLEALKLERQKRIAARSSSSTTTQSLSKNATKLSPSVHTSSKFSDLKLGFSPNMKNSPSRTTSDSPSRTTSIGSKDPRKPTRIFK